AQRSACVTLLISCPPSISPWGRESIWVGGDRIGRLTSGGWSVLRNTSIGMGYVHPDFSAPGTGVEVRIMNTRCPATIVEDSPYDPDNLVLQGG
ncbi:MAG: diguanylate cyclase, partial [Rhodobacteraceae bacterium]|nr:diguanylate cyclase [Paracoccaceae bacterium]